MKNIVIIISLLLHSITIFGQEEQILEVFKTDSTWTKEFIKFPIGFAPDINYEGYEDLRFAEGWAKKDSPEFWSYIFAWHINGNQEQTVEKLETNLKLYFNGLMTAVNKKKIFKYLIQRCHLLKLKTTIKIQTI